MEQCLLSCPTVLMKWWTVTQAVSCGLCIGTTRRAELQHDGSWGSCWPGIGCQGEAVGGEKCQECCFPAGSGNRSCWCPSTLRSIIQVLFESAPHAESRQLGFTCWKTSTPKLQGQSRAPAVLQCLPLLLPLWQQVSVAPAFHLQAWTVWALLLVRIQDVLCNPGWSCRKWYLKDSC